MKQEQRQALRTSLRQRRNHLTPEQQLRASEALLQNFLSSPYASSERVALYLAADSEIDPRLLCEHLWNQGACVYLPRLIDAHMEFAHYQPGKPLRPNKYGIPEPEGTQVLAAQELDLILLPAVGFDRQGNRLGMGGGFYDRTLASVRDMPSRPQLVALAHQCQKVEQLPTEPWDISMDAVITDLELYQFGG